MPPIHGAEKLVSVELIATEPVTLPPTPPRQALADHLDGGSSTPVVPVHPTHRKWMDPPAPVSEKARLEKRLPKPLEDEEAPVDDPKTHRFVRADPDVPRVETPDTDVISDRTLTAPKEVRREVSTVRIGPHNSGDPSSPDHAGAAAIPDRVSMPQVERDSEKEPRRENLEEASQPGVRSGGQPEESRAEAPMATETGAPGGLDLQRVASQGAEAMDARGVRDPGEAGDDAPTRDGLAFASDGDFPVPATGGADPADPRPEGPDLPSRSKQAIRPLLSPGTLNWIAPAEAADGGKPRTEAGEGQRVAPISGEEATGDGQALSGPGTAATSSDLGEVLPQKGSRSAAGGRGSARTDSALVVSEDAFLDVQSAISAIETPAGRYAGKLDQALRDRWSPPVEAQVMSGYGVTTVVFRLNARGKVLHKELQRHSGVPGLDAAALAAVPERFPRPQTGVISPGKNLEVTYTFRHSSPIVSRTGVR